MSNRICNNHTTLHTIRPATRALVAFLFFAAASAAGPRIANAAGGPTLADVIAGRAAPLTLQLKNLDGGDWRRLRITLPADTTATAGPEAMERALTAALGGPAPSAYFTKGQIVTIDGQGFLVAYRPKSELINLKKPQPAKLTPETTLTLSLISLRSATAFDDIRPFDLAEEMKAQSAAVSAASDVASDMVLSPETPAEANLRQLGLALLMYAQDHGDMLPAMKDSDTVQNALAPYVPDAGLFVNPDTRQAFIPNPVLSGRKYAHITGPESMVALYEVTPAADGSRAVLFLDGNVRRITGGDWPKLAHSSKIAMNH